eukprot:TRINITY_DN1465_c0_g1_i5.p1 TRINITY_DN1465_c0_g1~~TRINITY_DN1465_c0_g1_i5.p1  ORF type:complete len:116 (+),score=13.08 TRINITY_DN1465_c0_g1_i5:79-426(+)
MASGSEPAWDPSNEDFLYNGKYYSNFDPIIGHRKSVSVLGALFVTRFSGNRAREFEQQYRGRPVLEAVNALIQESSNITLEVNNDNGICAERDTKSDRIRIHHNGDFLVSYIGLH